MVMVAVLAASLLLLFLMPAESDETTEQLVTYASLALYVVGLSLLAPVIYLRGKRKRPAGARSDSVDEDGEYEDETSEIEREFEALEKEIEREERG